MTTDRESMARQVCEAMGWEFKRVTDGYTFFWNPNDTEDCIGDRDSKALHAIIQRAKTSERQVGELVEAAKELLVARGSPLEVCGHHPQTGHPLNREGKAVVAVDAIINRINAERGGQ